DRVLQTRVMEMPASHATVPIDVTAAATPNGYVSATVVRAIQPDQPWRVHRAYGVTRLRVDESDRRLNVAITAATEIHPRSRLTTSVRVTDAVGAPMRNAAVTLAAVDEGVLQLTAFATPDPFAFFTCDRALAVTSADLYSLLMPEVP